METLEKNETEERVQDRMQEEDNRKNFIENYLHSQSYQKDFVDFMVNMLNKYGVDIFNLNGIGEQLDMNKAIKKMAGADSVANGSIDSNANAGSTSAISIMHEITKPMALLQSYYRLWKWLKKNRSLDIANKFVEAQISGAFYVNDMHYISYPMPYSYYGKTVITVKYRGQILYLNMEDLFKMFENNIEILPDRETIDLSNVNISILDKGNKFVKLTRVLRHKSHCGLLKFETKNGRTTIVTEDHPVILENGEEKQASEISIGDRLMISDCSYTIFDSGNHEIDRTKYIVGFTLGDGHLILGGTRGSNQLSIKQKDLENHKVYQYIKEESPSTANTLHDGGNGTQRVNFGTKCWVCKNAQINHGAQNKVFPKDVLNWDKNEILSFIAGLIDADGCVNPRNGVVDVRITAFSTVQQMAELLRSLGFERVRTSLMDTQKREYQFGSNYDMYRVSFVVNDKNIDLVNFSDKLQKYKDIVLKERGKDGRFETNEVLKIRSFEQEYVYDITTETGTFSSQGLIQHNCYNHSCLSIAMQGLVGIDSKNNTVPPKYLRSYFDTMEAYLLIAGNSTAGATGISNLLVVASIFLKKMINNGFIDSHVQLKTEEDCWQYFKEELTSFIYKLNQPCRGNQSLFTNVSIFDDNFLSTIIPESQLVIDDEIYGTDLETVKKCQEIYLDIMNEEAQRVVHTFPVTTACFSVKYNKETKKNEILDKNFLDFICKKNEKRGFINIYAGDTATLSSCCRLRSDKNNVFFNSFGGASDSIGSMGVVCLNLPQLAFKYKDNFKQFKEELHNLTLLAQEVNYAKRCMLKISINKGHLPLYTNGYMDLSKQFSTTGFIGLYECCEIFGQDIVSAQGLQLAVEILSLIEKTNDEVSEKYKIPCNLEGIPGENTCVKLALKDRKIGYNDKYELYSNQFVPLHKRCNLLDRITLSSTMDKLCSGGSIMHITIDNTISAENMKNIATSIIESGVKYFAFNYEVNFCKECNYIFVGKKSECPKCGSSKLDKFMRVVGFLTKKTDWSKARQEEDRQYYNFE